MKHLPYYTFILIVSLIEWSYDMAGMIWRRVFYSPTAGRPISLDYPGVHIRSTVRPDRQESYNDLACRHAGRGAEAMYSRMKSMILENQ